MASMKIIVLGSAGMLGHVVGIFLTEKYGQRVVLSARAKSGIALIDQGLSLIDLADYRAVEIMIAQHRPCVVVNCAAVNDAGKGFEELDKINTRLPLAIASLLDEKKDGSRLIHISTDGVFRGDRGHYSEEDSPDADDLYGKSKRAGEVTRSPHLTIRTSIIGPDPLRSRGLMSWFMSQDREVKGYFGAGSQRSSWQNSLILPSMRIFQGCIIFVLIGFPNMMYLRSSKMLSVRIPLLNRMARLC
jgi:dTDP-4-dehydrorhamnose reductase